MGQAMRFDFVVTYDDESTTEVRAGQREMAAWEREPFGSSTLAATDRTPMVFFRYLAWSALKRLGTTTLSLEEWEATVESVDLAEDDDPKPDPTKTGQLTGS